MQNEFCFSDYISLWFHMLLITCDECFCIIMTHKVGTFTNTASRVEQVNNIFI